VRKTTGRVPSFHIQVSVVDSGRAWIMKPRRGHVGTIDMVNVSQFLKAIKAGKVSVN
jgi:hypothetical protein